MDESPPSYPQELEWRIILRAIQLQWLSIAELDHLLSDASEAKPRGLLALIIDRKLLQPAQVEDLLQLSSAASTELSDHSQNTQASSASSTGADAGQDTRASLVTENVFGQDATRTQLQSSSQSQAAQETEFDFDDPTIAGRYKIVRFHAEGGLGQVAVALDTELKRIVALKQIKPDHCHEPTNVQRFLREAELTGTLEHPGIVPVYGMGTKADGSPYYAMRFVKGDSLKHAIETYHASLGDAGHRPLELRQLLRRFIDVCNTIEYAHSQKIIHRDIKPANVMLGPYGETLVVDWGLARRIQDANSASESVSEPTLAELLGELSSCRADQSDTITMEGQVVGTVVYMSPEQARGYTDKSSDIFSLGATLYCILTGRAPYNRSTTKPLLHQALEAQPPRPRELQRDIPGPLESICLKAMARDPHMRYAGAVDLAADIEAWMADAPTVAHHESIVEKWSRLLRKHRTWTQAAAGSLVLLSIGATVAAILINGARVNEREARGEADRALTQAKLEARMSNALRLAGSSLNKRVRAPVESGLLALEAAELFIRDKDPIPAQVRSELYGSLMDFHGEPVAKLDNFPRWLRMTGQGLLAVDGRYRFERHQVDSAGSYQRSQQIDLAKTGAAWHPEGRYLVQPEAPNRMRFWDLEHSATPVDIETEIDDPFFHAEFDSIQPYLVTVHNRHICLWEIEAHSLKLIHKVEHALTSSMRYVASLVRQQKALLATESQIYLIDWKSSQITTLRELSATLGSVFHLTPDQRRLILNLTDGTLQVWNLVLKEPTFSEYRLSTGYEELKVAAFDPNRRWAALAGFEGRIWLLSLLTDAAPVSVNAHADRIIDLKFTSVPDQLISVGRDGYCRIWDASAGILRAITQSHAHDGIVHALAFDAENRIVTGDEKGVIRRWDYDSIRLDDAAFHLKGNGSPWDIEYGDGDFVIISDYDGVSGWIPSERKSKSIRRSQRVQFESTNDTLAMTVVNDDDGVAHWLLTMSNDDLRCYDLKSNSAETPIQVLPLPEARSGMRLAYDGRTHTLVVSGSQTEIFRFQQGKLEYSHRLPLEAARDFSLAPSGKFASNCVLKEYKLFGEDFASIDAKPIATLPARPLKGRQLELGPDGLVAVMGYESSLGVIELYRLDDSGKLKLLHTLPGHASAISACQFSLNGKWLATASHDQTVRLWDLQSEGAPSATIIRGPKGSAVAVDFASNSRHLICAFETGDIYGFSLDITQIVSDLKSKCARELTSEEKAEASILE